MFCLTDNRSLLLVFRFEKVLQKRSRVFPRLKCCLLPSASSGVAQMSGYALYSNAQPQLAFPFCIVINGGRGLGGGGWGWHATSYYERGRRHLPFQLCCSCSGGSVGRGRERSPEQGSLGSSPGPGPPASPTQSEFYNISFTSLLFHDTTFTGTGIASAFLVPSSFYSFR